MAETGAMNQAGKSLRELSPLSLKTKEASRETSLQNCLAEAYTMNQAGKSLRE